MLRNIQYINIIVYDYFKTTVTTSSELHTNVAIVQLLIPINLKDRP